MSPAELVLKQFPNRVSLTVTEAGVALGYSRQSTYNMKSAGTFPVQISKVGRRDVVHLHDIINYLETGLPAHKKRSGRPTREESLRRAGLI